jgi:hypothetical protein
MKKFMQEGKLTDEVIQSIMQEEKPNQKEKPAFKDERIRSSPMQVQDSRFTTQREIL